MYNQTSNQATDADNHRHKADLQREIIMLTSDLNKKMGEKTQFDIEARRLKKEGDMIKVHMQENLLKLKKLEQEILMKKTEIDHLKKQLNLIH